MARITLPSGAWVELRDADTLRRSDKDGVLIRSEQLDSGGGQFAAGLAVRAALTERLVTAWSFDRPIPSEDPSSLDDLTIADSDALDAVVLPYRKALFPDFEPTPDPASPTRPSAA